MVNSFSRFKSIVFHVNFQNACHPASKLQARRAKEELLFSRLVLASQVLGSLVINAIFSKCGILDLLMSILLRRWKLESKSFLLHGSR